MLTRSPLPTAAVRRVSRQASLSEPVPGFGGGIDKPDPSVVPDGEGFACRVGPDLKVVGLCGGFGA